MNEATTDFSGLINFYWCFNIEFLYPPLSAAADSEGLDFTVANRYLIDVNSSNKFKKTSALKAEPLAVRYLPNQTYRLLKGTVSREGYFFDGLTF
jgi:hypothetical protein